MSRDGVSQEDAEFDFMLMHYNGEPAPKGIALRPPTDSEQDSDSDDSLTKELKDAVEESEEDKSLSDRVVPKPERLSGDRQAITSRGGLRTGTRRA